MLNTFAGAADSITAKRQPPTAPPESLDQLIDGRT